jgi:hypothetical protein
MHITEIVKQEQVSDEAIAVTVRCCSNPKTDSTFTIYGVHKLTLDQLNEAVDKHHSRVAAKCEGLSAGRDLLANLKKTSKTHDRPEFDFERGFKR